MPSAVTVYLDFVIPSVEENASKPKVEDLQQALGNAEKALENADSEPRAEVEEARREVRAALAEYKANAEAELAIVNMERRAAMVAEAKDEARNPLILVRAAAKDALVQDRAMGTDAFALALE